MGAELVNQSLRFLFVLCTSLQNVFYGCFLQTVVYHCVVVATVLYLFLNDSNSVDFSLSDILIDGSTTFLIKRWSGNSLILCVLRNRRMEFFSSLLKPFLITKFHS